MSGFNTKVPNQALGFRNGYGWGWREESGQTFYRYDTWENWSQYGVDIVCNDPAPGAGSSNLAVKIAVPVVVVAVAAVAVVSFFGGGYQLRKRWNAQRIRRVLSDSVNTLTTE